MLCGVSEMCEIVVMRNAAIVQIGTARTLYDAPADP